MVDVSKSLPLILMALAALVLAGCVKPYDLLHPEPTVVGNDLTLHESWCYETLGQIDCYVQPQPQRGGRLVNVDPQARYPLTTPEYNQAVAAGR